MTIIITPNTEGIRKAAAFLAKGEVVALPTDTVYGLSCDATNKQALEKIYALKRRPLVKALPILVRNLVQAEEIALLSPSAQRLAARFWPGALTLVVAARHNNSLALCGNTIALRVAASSLIDSILNLLGHPITATSANISGQPILTSAQQIMHTLGPQLPAILLPYDKGFSTNVALPSTIVRCIDTPVILRQGSIPAHLILEALGP